MTTITWTHSNTNAQTAANDRDFQRWCRKAGVLATKRQASKWHRKTGAAWKTMRGILPPKHPEA